MDCPRSLAQPTLRAWIVRAHWRNQLYTHGLSALAGATNFMRMDCPRSLAQPTLRAWIVRAHWRNQLYTHGKPTPPFFIHILTLSEGMN
jgi:hypothetical protein